MQGGKSAADTILDMRASGDYSSRSTKEYQRRWMKAYGHDFHMVPASRPPCRLHSPLQLCHPRISQLRSKVRLHHLHREA